MSEQQRQHVSAFADGEIGPALVHATVSALESDAGLGELWERYHLIGATIRSEPVRGEYRRIAAQVSQRIAEEPGPLPKPPVRHVQISRLAPFVGIALAASAAFLAVFAVPQLFSPGSSDALVVRTRQAGLAPPKQFLLASPTQRWHVNEPALENKLDRFLVNHQEQSSATGMKGFLPYATLVGYEARR